MGPGIRPDGTTWTMLGSLRGRLKLSDFPVTAATASSIEDAGKALPLPSADVKTKLSKEAGIQEPELRAVPPLEEWEAAVQCGFCSKWRPCGGAEAPKLMQADNGFACKIVGFSCNQEQKYSNEEIDAIF
eukprot:symbB.v1.2.011313.t1/scaffold755.1/size165019/11